MAQLLPVTTQHALAERIDRWLAEDVHTGDVTTNAIMAKTGVSQRLTAIWRAKHNGIIAGLFEAEAVFRRLDPELDWRAGVADGDRVAAGQELVRFTGTGHALLTAERTALNIAQRMAGIATAAGMYADAVADYGTQILDTRKTVPGLRDLDKKAVALGGAANHRMGLYDLSLIKDNHIAAAGGITSAIATVKTCAPEITIEVETTTLAEVDEALAAGCDYLLLDNMDTETLRTAVKRVAGAVPLETSGNVDISNLKKLAATGVDYISVGALTHSMAAFDISQRLVDD